MRIQSHCLFGLVLLAGHGDIQPAPAPPGNVRMVIAGDDVSISASNATMGQILQELADRTAMKVHMSEPLTKRQDIQFENLPFPEAMARLLKDHDFVMRRIDPISGMTGMKRPGATGELWVFSRSRHGNHEHPDTAVEDPAAPETAFSRLRRDSNDVDATMRLRAVTEMAALEGEEVERTLATMALYDESVPVREEAVLALAEVAGAIARPILEKALTDAELRVREAAMEAIAEVGGDESAWALGVALSDQEISLREDAVYALGRIGGESAIRMLQLALLDEEGRVREAAAEVLSDLQDRPHDTVSDDRPDRIQ